MDQNKIGGIRLMWMMVLFDLPVATKEERKTATEFRNFLLESGFEMAQFSVYLRFAGSRERSESYVRMVKSKAPQVGKVCILFFTDKQFGDIIHIENRKIQNLGKKPEQLTFF